MSIQPLFTETFTLFIQTSPAATTPLAGSELIPVIQGGVTRHIPASSLVPAVTSINPTFAHNVSTVNVLPTDTFIAVNNSPARSTQVILESSPVVGRRVEVGDVGNNAGPSTPITVTWLAGDVLIMNFQGSHATFTYMGVSLGWFVSP